VQARGAPARKKRVRARLQERPARRRRHRPGRWPRNGLLPARRQRGKPLRARPPRRRYGNLPRARRRPASLRWRRSLWQLLHLSRLLPRLSRQGPQCPWPSRSGRSPRHRQAWEAAAWRRGRQHRWEAARPLQQRHVRQRREPGRARARSLTGPLGRATTTTCRRLGEGRSLGRLLSLYSPVRPPRPRRSMPSSQCSATSG